MIQSNKTFLSTFPALRYAASLEGLTCVNQTKVSCRAPDGNLGRGILGGPRALVLSHMFAS